MNREKDAHTVVMDTLKDLYCEGIGVGKMLGRKIGLAEALKILRKAGCKEGDAIIMTHYNRVLAAEKATLAEVELDDLLPTEKLPEPPENKEP